MYARLRQKLAIAGSSQVLTTATSLGNVATSALMKDIARVACGYISSTADLNSELWDTANSEIVRTVAPGWSEYQSNYVNTATNIAKDTSSNTNIIYLRCPSQNTTTGNATIYKYTGIGFSNNYTLNTANYTWNIMIPWGVTDYTGSPTLTYRANFNTSSPTGTGGGRNPFRTDVLTEYMIYVSPRAFIISATYIGNLGTAPNKVAMWLEYPSTPLSQPNNHPNNVYWEVSDGLGSTAQSITTGTGAVFDTTAYNVPGGYSPAAGSDIITASNTVNYNLGLVYTTTVITGSGWQSLWSTATATVDLSTMKPNTFGTMANTADAAGTNVTIPAMPLLHFPGWDSTYDCSTLTGVYATKPALGSNGDTLTLNGQNYAYINATTMGYLIPRQ